MELILQHFEGDDGEYYLRILDGKRELYTVWISNKLTKEQFDMVKNELSKYITKEFSKDIEEKILYGKEEDNGN